MESLQSEEERISAKYGIELARVKEGLKVLKLIKSMPTQIEAGSQWFVLDMEWVKTWQEYIYFDILAGVSDKVPPNEPEMPEALSWARITKPNHKDVTADPNKDFAW